MSVFCTYCGVFSRHACSTYKRKYLREELGRCGNLRGPERRHDAMVQAGVATEADDTVQALSRENERLRRRLAELA